MTATSPDAPHRSRLRIAVIAHALRQGGGLSGGRSLVASIASTSQHTCLFTLPDLDEYRSISFDPARHEVVYYRRRGGMLGRWAYDTFRLERVVRAFAPDRILALGNRGIQNPPCPQAVFSRDAHMFYPSSHYGVETLADKLKLAYQRWRFVKDLRHAHLLFCQTEVARDRVRETHSYDGRIAIAPNALTTATLGGANTAEESASGESGSPFRLLCLGSYYPHKNLEAVVDMFEHHGDDLEDVVVVITIAAEQHPGARRLLERIRGAGLENRIINVGPVRQKEIARLYARSRALLLPTLLESFSRTYLEAMHFGVPILTSDLDFARVICGEAALYFDPFHTESIVDAVRRLRDDPTLGKALVDRGRRRLAETRTTWDEVAGGMLAEVEAMDAGAPNAEALDQVT